MKTYRDYAQEFIQSPQSTLQCLKKKCSGSCRNIKTKSCQLLHWKLCGTSTHQEAGNTPKIFPNPERISLHLFYLLQYLYCSMSSSGRTRGFKAQMGALLLHRNESKVHEFCHKEVDKRSCALDASGVLSVTG